MFRYRTCLRFSINGGREKSVISRTVRDWCAISHLGRNLPCSGAAFYKPFQFWLRPCLLRYCCVIVALYQAHATGFSTQEKSVALMDTTAILVCVQPCVEALVQPCVEVASER
uniref:Uncharacterized protein n=1 Tax=Sphaerodactylus townsendi TaxID=933632 RepID=A0ACB8EWF8_9SAUR